MGAESAERLLLQLAGSTQRSEVAHQIARALGAEELVVLVRDPEVAALIPPPGFPPTLPGGPDWRSLVRRCLAPGAYSAEVDLPADRRRRAEAIACEGMALVLLGDAPSASGLASLRAVLPLLAFAFGAEQKAHVAAAQAAEATKAAARAHALAESLDAARADASRLNAELRLEQQRKDHFLAMLAHELRNPLSPLVYSLDILKLGADTDPRVRERIEVMSRHAAQLSQLVDDLLDVARVSRGRIALRREVLALQDVVRQALEANAHLLEARSHRVCLALAEEPMMVEGDRTRLTQVFWNLLHNAGKYTEPGGRIDVRAFRDETGKARVEVSDTGSGIDAENIGQIFTLFHQAPVSLARSSGGLGIGLTLARTLVELHGGRIEARSDGLGRGSTFTVILPGSSREPVLTDRAPAEVAAVPATQTLRILVVDDNQDAADALGTVLGTLGHQPQAAYGGASALQLAAEVDPDLVFLDLGLPGMDGYEVARRLRRTLPRHPYLVALTGYSGPEYARRAHEAGFDEHVVKPVTLETIQAVAARAGRPRTQPGR